jgi:hypothetical protein
MDKNMIIRELGQSCMDICKLSYSLLSKYENQITRRLQLDDLFEFNELMAEDSKDDEINEAE